MAKRVFSRTRSPRKRSSEFSSVSDGGMFESRPFVVQSKVGEEGEKSGLKTSLMRAERYGHHVSQMQPVDVSTPYTVQPKMSMEQPLQPQLATAPPIQLTAIRTTKKKKTKRKPYPTKVYPNPTGKQPLSRRVAAGFQNPNHKHKNMTNLFKDAVVGTPPEDRELEDWLYSPERKFRVHTPTHTHSPKIVENGHSNTVMGHNPDAAQVWNESGHKQPIRSNKEHNLNIKSYHGLEDKNKSAASGSRTDRYDSPSPSKGSHPSYFDVTHENFNPRNPWINRFRQPDGKGGYTHVRYSPSQEKYVERSATATASTSSSVSTKPSHKRKLVFPSASTTAPTSSSTSKTTKPKKSRKKA